MKIHKYSSVCCNETSGKEDAEIHFGRKKKKKHLYFFPNEKLFPVRTFPVLKSRTSKSLKKFSFDPGIRPPFVRHSLTTGMSMEEALCV